MTTFVDVKIHKKKFRENMHRASAYRSGITVKNFFLNAPCALLIYKQKHGKILSAVTYEQFCNICTNTRVLHMLRFIIEYMAFVLSEWRLLRALVYHCFITYVCQRKSREVQRTKEKW